MVKMIKDKHFKIGTAIVSLTSQQKTNKTIFYKNEGDTMKKLKVKSMIVSLAVIFMMFITSTTIFAQQDDPTTQPTDPTTTQPNVEPQQEETPQQQDDENYTKIAKDLASDLQSRIDLSDQQVAQVQTILVDYQHDVAATAMNENNPNPDMNDATAQTVDPVEKANSKIDALLDDTQKAKFASIKADWWKQVNDQIPNKTSSTL